MTKLAWSAAFLIHRLPYRQSNTMHKLSCVTCNTCTTLFIWVHTMQAHSCHLPTCNMHTLLIWLHAVHAHSYHLPTCNMHTPAIFPHAVHAHSCHLPTCNMHALFILATCSACTLGGFNVSNLMGNTRRMIDIGKKITFYFLQNV